MDSINIDLGFHYPNWQYSNAGSSSLTADFDNNLKVDFNDLKLFASYWLYDYNAHQRCASWDLSPNGLIDFYDLDVFANNWLTEYDFVDFADFAKYWRKQIDYRFQDRRFDLAADNIVNFKDFAMFANQWRQETTGFDPNIQIQITGDPNNGYVDIGVTGWTSDTLRTFLSIDGQYKGEILSFQDGQTIPLNTSSLNNGMHEIKVSSIDSNSKIVCSNIMTTSLTCSLNYCVLPETYEKNQPLPFAAFNSSAGDITVKAYADGGTLVWSQTFSGNSILGFIPSSITNQYEFDYISFDTTGGVSIIEPIDPVEPPLVSENVQALIILPAWDLRWRDSRSVTPQVRASLTARGITYKELRGKYATYDIVDWYAWNKNIKYIYLLAHGNYRFVNNGVLRTIIYLYDGPVVSVKQSDFAPGQAPSWCQKLEGNYENTAKSFAMMFFESLEFVQFFSCYSGKLKINANNELVVEQEGEQGLFDIPHSDMSLALGMGESSRSRFYQGWYNDATVRYLPESQYQEFSRIEWETLGNGDDLY